MWLIVLSDQLPIVALVGRYPTNQLIGRRPLLQRLPPSGRKLSWRLSQDATVCGIVGTFAPVSPTAGQVTHVFLTRPPLPPLAERAFDLHVLGTPPAFVLSQDQTRHPVLLSLDPLARTEVLSSAAGSPASAEQAAAKLFSSG